MMYQASMSKSALLVWVREITNNPVTNLEDLSSGLHFCQLLQIYTKGKFTLNRIKKDPKTQTDCLHNLRILQYGMEEFKIPYKLDITLIARRNFRAILETLQWWRKQFSKLPADQFSYNPEKPKVKIQIKKPLQLVSPLTQPPKADKPPENKESSNSKTPKLPSHEEILQILSRNQKYSAPQQKLFPEDFGSESNKENIYNPYPSLENEPAAQQKGPTNHQTTEGDKIDRKQEEIKYSSRQKMNNYSFGRQQSFDIEKTQHLPSQVQSSKPIVSQKKSIHTPNIAALSVSPHPPQIAPQTESFQQEKKEPRVPMTYRSVQKIDPQQKQSKAKDEHPSTKPKSIPKVTSTTPQQSRDRREISPNISERTNLLSMMQVSEKKPGRMM